MRRRLTVNDRGELVDRDGMILGRIVSITLDIGAGERGTIGGEGQIGDLDVPSSQVEDDNSKGGTGGQSSMLPDPVDVTWELYVQLLDRPRAKLDRKKRKMIADAHQAVGIERTNAAIRGLAGSDYHRQNGYIGIEYALVPKRGETVEGRVEMMAARAGAPNGKTTVEELLGRVPSDQRWIMRDKMTDIVRAYAEDRPTEAADALSLLRDKLQAEPVVHEGRVTGWRRVAA